MLISLVVLAMLFSFLPIESVFANTATGVKVIVYNVTQSGADYTTSILQVNSNDVNTYNVSSGNYSVSTNNYMGLDEDLTTNAACVFDVWYLVARDLGYTSSNCTTNVSTGGKVYVSKFANLDTGTYSLASSGWMFVVNDVIPADANGNGYDAAHATLQDGDVVSIFYVTDYTNTKYLYFDETGAKISGQKILADGTDGEMLYLKLMEYSLNMADKYVTPKTGASGSISTTGVSSTVADVGGGVYTIDVTSSSVTGVKTAAGQTYSATTQLIPAYYPIDATVTTTLGDVKTVLAAVIDAYADEEAASASYTTASWNAFDAAYDDAVDKYNNSTSISEVLAATNRLNRLGADLIGVNDARLNRLGVTDGCYYTPAFSSDVHSYVYDNGTNSSETYQLGFINTDATFTASISGSGGSISYDNGADTVSPSGMTSGTYTITINVSCGTGNETYYLTVYKPSSSGLPNKVIGYLVAPSQYATGLSYGSISSDNSNSLNPTPPAYVKTLGSGGLVSLGSLGGYIVYEYSEPITDNLNNDYGIDLIVYGNAFTGWCEPGIVQVAERVSDGQGGYQPGTWYTIAGSEYYSDTSEVIDDIMWRMSGTTVQYSLDDGTNWTDFRTSAAGWWPAYAPKPTGENYGATSNHSLFPEYVLDFDSDSLKFDDLVRLDDNVYYQFGYCDVHPNGSNYGVMGENPYTATSSTSYGDGIDLAWAVNAAGEPVNMSGKNIYYIRIYTGVLENAGGLGEVSTEVTAVTKTTPGGSPVGTSSGPATLTVEGNDCLANLTAGSIPVTPIYITAETDVNVVATTSSGNAVYVNNARYTGTPPTATGTYNLAEGQQQIVRVIVQSGTAQPYIGYLLLEGQI